MTNLKRLFLLLGVGFLFVRSAFPQAGDAGGTGLAFLKVGVGARASAMGEAYTALSSDATATYWNPAGLILLSGGQVAFAHTEWLEDVSNDFLAIAFPLLGGSVGFSVYSNNVDGIERRVIPSEQPLGTIDANDIAAGISYGRSLSERLAAGVTVKYLYEKIFTASVAGYAFDFGVRFKPLDNPLIVAAVVQNLGSMGTLAKASIDLPTTVRVGASYRFPIEQLGGALLLAADGVKVADNNLRGNFGLELSVRNHLAFRLGYQAGFDEKSVAGGFGLNFSRYYLDYGYAPFDSNLGDTHRFSFGLDL
ncbi:PorV/PorQ family protein [candidate division KSB1 bacterium]|nr:PorV/PorQ family protein [candidate division KSB1 bacterium]